MNITLKQAEIEAAIRQYTERQGISLHNKSLVIKFTSGRGDNGLSAELVIENVSIPGFDAPEVTTAPSAAVQAMVAAVAAAAPQAEQVILPGGGEIKPVVEAAPAPVVVEAPAPVADEVATAAIATPATEAAAAEPIAEAKVADTPVTTPAVDPAAPPRATTSLFAS